MTLHPEIFEGPAFRQLLHELETQFDLIVFDAPPALLTSDAQILAKHIHAIALVLRAGRDQRGMIERMIRGLDSQHADILGVILNGVRSASGGYFRKSYQDFYRYRNGTERNGDASSLVATAGLHARRV